MREMKDSGIEWVGAIPATWQMHPLYYYFCERKCRNTLGKENNLLSLSYGRVIRKDINTVDGLLPENYTGYNIIEKDDIVLRLTDLQNDKRSLRTGLVREHGIITSAYTTIKANRELVPEFFQYLLHSYDAMKVLYNMGSGVRQGLNFSELSKMPLISPDMLEQKKIADFLDAKCSEIDAISANIQKEIETLEQYKRSVITEAVTKGLNPDVKMKNSGMAWCRQIPAHWEPIPSKYLFHNSDTRKYPNDELLTASQKYGVISQTDYMLRENVSVVMANKGIENWKHIEPNDFVISLRSFQGGLEMSEITGCVTWHYVVLKASKQLYPRYFKWLFKSSKYINALQSTCNFIRDGQDLRFSNFAKVPLFEPPYSEQVKISNYLDNKVTSIEYALADKKKQLAVIDFYKKSLIYEYVTGKKEVPNEQ